MNPEELEKRKAEILKASQAARAKADAVADPQLAAINEQADALRSTFEELKLTDKAAYDKLVEIVEDASRRNLAIGTVVERVKALGEAGAKVAGVIGNLSGGGAVSALNSLLKR